MKIVQVVLSLLLLATFTGAAGAEDWPTRRLRIVVPFPAGGSGDVQVRIVADELAKVLGQPVIVENKPGASGGLAAVDVAHAPPDGYTLMLGSVGTHHQCQPLFEAPIRSRQGFCAAHAHDGVPASHRPGHQLQRPNAG